jgi:recombinational DNA repair protein RecR
MEASDSYRGFKEDKMTYVERAVLRTEHARHVCNVCGKAGEDTICESCSIKIRAEALIIKRHEDQGEA